jgi:hypothetical protein
MTALILILKIIMWLIFIAACVLLGGVLIACREHKEQVLRDADPTPTYLDEAKDRKEK